MHVLSVSTGTTCSTHFIISKHTDKYQSEIIFGCFLNAISSRIFLSSGSRLTEKLCSAEAAVEVCLLIRHHKANVWRLAFNMTRNSLVGYQCLCTYLYSSVLLIMQTFVAVHWKFCIFIFAWMSHKSIRLTSHTTRHKNKCKETYSALLHVFIQRLYGFSVVLLLMKKTQIKSTSHGHIVKFSVHADDNAVNVLVSTWREF